MPLSVPAWRQVLVMGSSPLGEGDAHETGIRTGPKWEGHSRTLPQLFATL